MEGRGDVFSLVEGNTCVEDLVGRVLGFLLGKTEVFYAKRVCQLVRLMWSLVFGVTADY